MQGERKTLWILLAVFLIPAVVFFLKPEINFHYKFAKVSWGQGYHDVKDAVKTGNTKGLFKKVYGGITHSLDQTHIRWTMEDRYKRYLYHSKVRFNKFIYKWKLFLK